MKNWNMENNNDGQKGLKSYLSEGRGQGRCFKSRKKNPQMLLKAQRRRNKSKEQYDIKEESGFREKKQKKMRGEMLVSEYVEILECYRWG